jgi:hypothetical protein
VSAARIRLAALVLLVLGVPALVWMFRDGGEKQGGTDPATAKGAGVHPDTLSALVREIQRVRAEEDRKRLLDLVYAMLPQEADWRAILRAGPDTDAFLAARDRRVPPRSEETELATLAEWLFPSEDAALTGIREHAATTEALAAAPADGGLAGFPEGMVRFAQRIAAPGRTWYTVELQRPGRDRAARTSSFTRLGDRWLFVPSPWRGLPRDE